MAMQAPAEKLAYVAALNPPGSSLNDAILVIDVAPASAGHGRRVGQIVLRVLGTMKPETVHDSHVRGAHSGVRLISISSIIPGWPEPQSLCIRSVT
jgi:hypothetical protein